MEESWHLNVGIVASDAWRTYGQPVCSNTPMLTSMHTDGHSLIKLPYAADIKKPSRKAELTSSHTR